MEYINAIFIYIIFLNIIATYRLLKSNEYTSNQKLIQLGILWCIPFIGTLLVAYFLNQNPIILKNKILIFKIMIKVVLWFLLIKVVWGKRKTGIDNSSNQSHVGEGFVNIGSGD